MEVILKKDVANVGRMGEVVRVRSGFARNFLVPRSLAVVASSGDKRNLEHQQRLIEKEKAKVREASQAKAGEIKKITVSLKKKFNEHNKMFGSVTSAEVAQLLKKEGHEFDRRDIELPELSGEGTFEVKVRLPGDVFTTIQLTIVAELVKEKKAAKAPKAKKADGEAQKAASSEKEEIAESVEAKAEDESSKEA